MVEVGGARVGSFSSTSSAESVERTVVTLWHHPHARGALVVEETDGQLSLLFAHDGDAAWDRRRAWRGGMSTLLPVSSPEATTLAAGLGLLLDDSAMTTVSRAALA